MYKYIPHYIPGDNYRYLQVIGALTSVLLIWIVTGILFYLAIERIIHKNFELDTTVMLITSAVGVAVNLVLVILHYIRTMLKIIFNSN